ncbi:hypothetical protein BH23VER1_BH23VER1_29480 [soil metagenome]
MERGCYHVSDEDFAARFPLAVDGRCWPNSGGYMGSRRRVERVPEYCVGLHQRAAADRLPPLAARWRHLGHLRSNDQWIFQLASLSEDRWPDRRVAVGP